VSFSLNILPGYYPGAPFKERKKGKKSKGGDGIGKFRDGEEKWVLRGG
jgi:hypothetical protein